MKRSIFCASSLWRRNYRYTVDHIVAPVLCLMIMTTIWSSSRQDLWIHRHHFDLRSKSICIDGELCPFCACNSWPYLVRTRGYWPPSWMCVFIGSPPIDYYNIHFTRTLTSTFILVYFRYNIPLHNIHTLFDETADNHLKIYFNNGASTSQIIITSPHTLNSHHSTRWSDFEILKLLQIYAETSRTLFSMIRCW